MEPPQVYNPVMKELFTAVTGRGATLNGNPISCSNTTSLGSALLATEVGGPSVQDWVSKGGSARMGRQEWVGKGQEVRFEADVRLLW